MTKHQFMQVAMIAQGEFMELLRAKSDAKKLIFRKLFHTELYAQVTEELANRRPGEGAGAGDCADDGSDGGCPGERSRGL